MSDDGADIGQAIAMLAEVLHVQLDDGDLNVLKTRLDELASGLNGLQGSLTELCHAVGHYHASVLGTAS